MLSSFRVSLQVSLSTCSLIIGDRMSSIPNQDLCSLRASSESYLVSLSSLRENIMLMKAEENKVKVNGNEKGVMNEI